MLLEPLSPKTVVSPNTATFECDIAPGKPEADIHYFKDNKEITAGDKYNMSNEDEVVTLEILESDLDDAAVYKVTASNKLGKVETEANLTVHSNYPNHKLVMVTNRSVLILCHT